MLQVIVGNPWFNNNFILDCEFGELLLQNKIFFFTKENIIRADAELQPLSVRGGEDFTADFTDFTFVHDHFFNNFQLNLYFFRVRLG